MELTPTVRAVLFDAVGTLIYADPPVAKIYTSVGQRFGSQLTQSQVAARFHSVWQRHQQQRLQTSHSAERERWRAIVAEVFHDVPDAGSGLYEALWEHFALSSSWAIYDDVQPTWQALRARNVLVGIASNFDDRLVGICEQLMPLSTCQHTFWSAQLGFSKPHPEFYRSIQRQLQLDPEEILLVGDHPSCDFEGPRSVQWNAMLLDRSSRPDGRQSIPRLTEIL